VRPISITFLILKIPNLKFQKTNKYQISKPKFQNSKIWKFQKFGFLIFIGIYLKFGN